MLISWSWTMWGVPLLLAERQSADNGWPWLAFNPKPPSCSEGVSIAITKTQVICGFYDEPRLMQALLHLCSVRSVAQEEKGQVGGNCTKDGTSGKLWLKP